MGNTISKHSKGEQSCKFTSWLAVSHFHVIGFYFFWFANSARLWGTNVIFKWPKRCIFPLTTQLLRWDLVIRRWNWLIGDLRSARVAVSYTDFALSVPAFSFALYFHVLPLTWCLLFCGTHLDNVNFTHIVKCALGVLPQGTGFESQSLWNILSIDRSFLISDSEQPRDMLTQASARLFLYSKHINGE